MITTWKARSFLFNHAPHIPYRAYCIQLALFLLQIGFNPPSMKQFLHDLRSKAESVFQLELATKDRPLGFRIIVLTLVVVNVVCITLSIIRSVG